MNKEKSKMIAFSFAFSNKSGSKEKMLSENGGIDKSHVKFIGAETYDIFQKFFAASLDEQRSMVAMDSKKIINAFITAILQLDSENSVLEILLPYLDAILFGKLIRRHKVL